MKNFKKTFALLMIIVICFASFISCESKKEDLASGVEANNVGSEEKSGIVSGGIVNIALTSSPKNLDPIFYHHSTRRRLAL